MRTRVGRSEDALLSAMTEPEASEVRVAAVVKRLRPDQLERLLAMTPGDRLDRALALLELARDMGAGHGLRKR